MYLQLRIESQHDLLLIFTIAIILLSWLLLISKWTYDICSIKFSPLIPLFPEKKHSARMQVSTTQQDVDIFTDTKDDHDDGFLTRLSIPQDVVSQMEKTLDEINDMRQRRGKYRDRSRSAYLIIKKLIDSNDIASRIINTVTEIRFLKDDMVNGISIITSRQIIGIYIMNSLGSASKFDCNHDNLESFIGGAILKLKHEKMTYSDSGGTIITKKIRIVIETDRGLLKFRLIGRPLAFVVFWNDFTPGYF